MSKKIIDQLFILANILIVIWKAMKLYPTENHLRQKKMYKWFKEKKIKATVLENNIDDNYDFD